jgi:8-oxo-dGTP pyrophosphatase MutT (NUDIX family)
MVRVIHRGRIVDLRVETVALPNGLTADLELIAHRGAAAVAAVDDPGRVILIRQFRYAARGYLWELPAGVLDGPDEAPVVCAGRELAEEVGIVARELQLLGTVFPSPGFCEERIHLFLGRGLTETAPARGADEVIAETRWVPIGEALEMIRRGEIVDGKTIAGLFLAASTLGRLA